MFLCVGRGTQCHFEKQSNSRFAFEESWKNTFGTIAFPRTFAVHTSNSNAHTEDEPNLCNQRQAADQLRVFSVLVKTPHCLIVPPESSKRS